MIFLKRKLLEENRKKYLKSGNFAKAETAYKRIKQLKGAENDKIEEELKQTFFNNKSHLEDDQVFEINSIKEQFDSKTKKIKDKYKEFQYKLQEKNKKEIIEFIEIFEKKNKIL